MNDEPSSSAAAADYPEPISQDEEAEQEVPITAAEVAKRRKRNRENFNKRRGELLDDLLRNLDILVYAELSAIYYMDCSFTRFLLRAIVQLMFLTPKPALFPEPPPNRPYIGGIFGSNILCFLLHAIFAAPSAGEQTRGYLHGGLAMDFIGQKGPTSKVHLLVLDILVLVMQVVQLSVHVLKMKLKDGSSTAEATPVAVTTSDGDTYSAQPVSAGQSLDDEERGVRRSVEVTQGQDIEMQNLSAGGLASDAVEPESSERESLMASTSMPTRTDAYIFDAFNSGQILIADLDLWKTVRDEFVAWKKTPRSASTTAANAEANRLMRERLTRRMLRWRG
ncbi:Hypothetical predicted protein [Lecanosticta acicola]|uniref:DUF1746 domain-containing protein n=1 Tax=Lecanosticta acicola TaxID=111012 RepID=A0AAI8Z736_9PEZI|nr:Hypothetical predicted protein [Lecanosticta acicola]